MEKYIAANLKMNNDFSDIKPFLNYVKKNQKNRKNLIVCVPSTLLKTFVDTAKGLVETGAENCYYAEKGAFTGEISHKMVKSTGASYVIIGHSERRQIFGETNELLAKKLEAALKMGLKVIYCIGETLEERTKFKSVLKKEIVESADNNE